MRFARALAVAGIIVGTVGVVMALGLPKVLADAPSSGFALQVTPSPLVTTVQPGQTTTQQLQIRNAGLQTEQLKIELRSFSINQDNGQVDLGDTAPAGVASWVSFSAPKFSAAAGQWFTENIKLSVPKDAGFSYSFALVISRQVDPKPTAAGHLIKGSVAVFSLINVSRPGAVSDLSIAELETDKHVYQYLPATFHLKVKNVGNTIVQPFGNIFIQRGSGRQTPLATLPVNPSKGYVLPGTERTLSVNWTDGFPAYQPVIQPDGTTKERLTWDWTKLSSFRIGRYTAQVVAVYNDGQRDVPIEGEISFWVLPWKLLLALLLVVLLVLFGLWSVVRKVFRLGKRLRPKQTKQHAEPPPEKPSDNHAV